MLDVTTADVRGTIVDAIRAADTQVIEKACHGRVVAGSSARKGLEVGKDVFCRTALECVVIVIRVAGDWSEGGV